MRFPPRHLAARVLGGLIVGGLSFSLLPIFEAEAASKNLVVNGSFSARAKGWSVTPKTARLSTVKPGTNRFAKLRTTVQGGRIVLNDKVNTVKGSAAGVTYLVSVRVKSNKGGRVGTLRVRESAAGKTIRHQRAIRLPDRKWHRFSFEFTTTKADSTLDLNLIASKVATSRRIYVDSVRLVVVDEKESTAPTPGPSASPTSSAAPTSGATSTATAHPTTGATGTASATPTTGSTTIVSAAPTAGATSTTSAAPTSVATTQAPAATAGPTASADGYQLSNGCSLNARGVGSCAPMVGAAYNSNTDPTTWEASLGQHLSIRRTYWASTQVASAVRTAKADVAAGRIPWISFKLGHSWTDMASGSGDAWAKDLASRLATVDGPVWVAFHHEPEGEGSITAWTKMQERLGPMMRTAPNVAFTVILTGWHQLYGESQYSLESLWPNTTVDVAGFDIYCFYGTYLDGVYRTPEASLKANYFEPISKWAKAKGIAWGLAETGLTDAASIDNPHWIQTTYGELRDTGAIAMSYFNTSLNTEDVTWLTAGAKTEDFKTTLKLAPSFPKQ